MFPEDGETQGVKREDRDVFPDVGEQGLQAGAHLVRGAAGKRNRQTVGRRDIAVSNQIGDAMGQGPGFAGTGPGNDQDGARPGLDSPALVRIQFRDGLVSWWIGNRGFLHLRSGARRRLFGDGRRRGRRRRCGVRKQGPPDGMMTQFVGLKQPDRPVGAVVSGFPDDAVLTQARDGLGRTEMTSRGGCRPAARR